MGRQIVPDTAAGEYSVETGTGNVLKIERDPAKRNAQVFIRADHLQRPIRGWLDTHDLELLGRLEAAQSDHAGRLAYRIDVRRDSSVAADLPWADVPQTARFRRLVGITTDDRLADLLPAAVMAGAAASTQTAPPAAPVAASRPAPAPAADPDPAPPGGSGDDRAPRCVVCGESVAGRPVKRTPRGYVHTDTDCMGAPFDDDGFAGKVVDPDAEPGDGQGILAAGLAATAQRAAHRNAPTAPDAGEPAGPPEGQAPDDGADDGVWTCELCQVTTNEPRAQHDASPVHQGKTRQQAQADELAARRTAAQRDASTFASEAAATRKPAPVPVPARRGARIEEGRPWERYNSDGSVNMGSYAITAALGMVELAQRLAVRRLQTIAEETGAQQHLDLAQVRSLARYLLDAADRCQAAVRDDGHTDRMDNSHTRARGAVRMALDVYPVPWGSEADVRAKWIEDLAAHAAFLLQLAVELDR